MHGLRADATIQVGLGLFRRTSVHTPYRQLPLRCPVPAARPLPFPLPLPLSSAPTPAHLPLPAELTGSVPPALTSSLCTTSSGTFLTEVANATALPGGGLALGRLSFWGSRMLYVNTTLLPVGNTSTPAPAPTPTSSNSSSGGSGGGGGARGGNASVGAVAVPQRPLLCSLLPLGRVAGRGPGGAVAMDAVGQAWDPTTPLDLSTVLALGDMEGTRVVVLQQDAALQVGAIVWQYTSQWDSQHTTTRSPVPPLC